MNGTSVHVKIFKADKCIYENNNSVVLNANNLGSLISCLKDTRLEVNDFLTSLVEEQRCSTDAGDRLTSESDTDFEDEVEVVNPKKSKLTDQ